MTPDSPSDTPENPSTAHAGHGHATLDLEHFVPYRLSVLSNRVSQTISGIYHQRFGLAHAEFFATNLVRQGDLLGVIDGQ